jgi:hypothetical protein
MIASCQRYLVVFSAVISMTAWSACGSDNEDTDANGGQDTISQQDARLSDVEILPLPDFIARIQASPASGNSPLDVSFSVDLQGDVQPYELSYSWLIAETVGYSDSEFTHTFFQKGNHSVSLKVTYTSADGRVQVSEDLLTITVAGCADLKWNQISMAPPVEVAAGDLVSLKQGTLFNEGDRIDSKFTVGVYLSLNEVFEPDNDKLISQWELDGMDSGIFSESKIAFEEKTFQVPDDVEDGLYFVFILADDTNSVNECQEDNNLATSTNNLSVDSAVALKSDLLISNVGFTEGIKLDVGDNLNYQYRIENVGEGEAAKFGFGFWLSSDKKLDPEEDILMFGPEDLGATMQQMPAGGSQNFYKSYKVPESVADGQYWMIGMVDVDNQVYESEEGNNIGVSPFQVTVEYKEEQCYDMGLDEFEVSPLASYWKGTVQAAMKISNTGTVATPDNWGIKAYISLQASLNPATATEVGNWTIGSIAPGEVLDVSKIITIPNNIPVQPHYVGVILDPDGAMTECSEGNNASMFPEPVAITSTATMDVSVNNVQYHPPVVEAGNSIKVSYILANSGTSNATAFKTIVVLSPDKAVTYGGINNGQDLIIHEAFVANVPAKGTVSRVEDVEIPIALEHTITNYYVGIVADPDKNLQLDKSKNNNILVADAALTVEGAQGGCFEDDYESNNTFGSASSLEPGFHADLGSCGNEDWYKVTVPAEHSLIVKASIAPILGVNAVGSDLDIELLDSGVKVVDSSDNVGDTEEVYKFNVAQEEDFYIRVAPKMGNGNSTLASYDLDIQVLEPVDGIELLSVDVDALPKNIYPGGLMNVSWATANIGKDDAIAHKAQIWASKDATLEPQDDILLEEVDQDSVGGNETSQSAHTFLLPADIAGGNWRFLVLVDSDESVTEVNEDNNVGASDIVFLDPLLTCDDDDLEPNNDIELSSPITLKNGLVIVQDAVACPSLDDWYAVDAEEGNSLNILASYSYDNNKGLLGVEVWDVTKSAMLFKNTSIDSASVQIPWVWSSGTYYIRVHASTYKGKIGPYEYDLTVTSGPGDSSDECQGDVFEDNNGIDFANFVGCGLQGATLCKGDVDAYRIELDQWDSLTVTLNHPDGALKMSLFESGAMQASGSKSGNGILSYQSDVEQTVYLVVESKSDPLSLKNFDYTLFLDGVKGVDLTISEPSLFMSEVYQGDDALIDFSVVNSCVDVVGEFTTSIWLSADDALDENDVFLKAVSLDGVASKGTVELSEKVVVPFSTQPGNYHVIAEADSDNVIEESNEGNNSTGTGITVAKLCLPDVFEPNDVLSQADPFAPGVDVANGGANGLALCPYELDWYSIQVVGGTAVTAEILFDQQEGDLDMRLYDPSYSTTIPIAVSSTNNSNESITYAVGVTGTYLIRVHGFDGGSASYDLNVSAE